MVTVVDCLQRWTATTLLSANEALLHQKAKQQEWQEQWNEIEKGAVLQAFPIWRFDRCVERVHKAEDNLQRLQLLDGLLKVALCVRGEAAAIE